MVHGWELSRLTDLSTTPAFSDRVWVRYVFLCHISNRSHVWYTNWKFEHKVWKFIFTQKLCSEMILASNMALVFNRILCMQSNASQIMDCQGATKPEAMWPSWTPKP